MSATVLYLKYCIFLPLPLWPLPTCDLYNGQYILGRNSPTCFDYPGNIKKSRIVKNMKPALYSVSQNPRGGVIVYSHPDYELLNHSVRRSRNRGHYAIGVYITPTNSKLIVAGIYGPSANNDRESIEFYNEVRQTLDELSNTFGTNNFLLAGDFNAVLNPTDSSSEHHTKKNTTNLLNNMIEELHLVYLASRARNTQHTWIRRNNNKISSRLDLIYPSSISSMPPRPLSLTMPGYKPPLARRKNKPIPQ
jgi:hypothetical protein